MNPRRDAWLIAICAGRIFAYANFMVFAACLPVLREQWRMSAAEGIPPLYAITREILASIFDEETART